MNIAILIGILAVVAGYFLFRLVFLSGPPSQNSAALIQKPSESETMTVGVDATWSLDKLQSILESSSRPHSFIVMIRADYCGGCKMMTPIFESIHNNLQFEPKYQNRTAKFDIQPENQGPMNALLGKHSIAVERIPALLFIPRDSAKSPVLKQIPFTVDNFRAVLDEA